MDLDQIADRIQIEQTIFKYNRSIDTGDKEEFLSVFAEDGVKFSPIYWGELRGREVLGVWFDRFLSDTAFQAFRGGQHRVSNLIFEKLDDTTAETWSNFTLVMPTGSGPYISVIGNYHDIFEKQDGQWRIKWRTIEIVEDGTKKSAET